MKLSIALAAAFVLSVQPFASADPEITLAPDERLITVLGTNDIHGGVEAQLQGPEKAPIGGMAFWGGVVRSIRTGLAARYGAERAGALVLDAGDQFQGTLLSNYNEGQVVFSAMDHVGYDAVVTGNHDYDFGPIGWLEDKVVPGQGDQNKRGALERLIGSVRFPVISANTYVRASLVDAQGKRVTVDNRGCKSKSASVVIDWSRAERAPFVKPYVVKQVAGVRVAVIAIDNSGTPSTTTPENVEDLCFDDEKRSYLRARAELEGKADVFVMLVHNGNTNADLGMSKLIESLPDGAVDAVISGHTHFVNNARAGGVAIIQSGSGGTRFGRVDLVYNVAEKRLDTVRTRAFAGVELQHERCVGQAKSFCTMVGGKVAYEGVVVEPSREIEALVAPVRAAVDKLAHRKLGHAHGAPIRVDRTRESPLANAMTDAFRGLAKTEIAFMNTGGIRAPLPAGDFTYEDLFEVIPFNNHGLVIGPMPVDRVVALLAKSVQTCGSFGALMQSGLRVTFERDCANAGGQVDSKARLLTVTTLDGEAVYDAARGGIVAPAGREFLVATLDFLAAGGAGFEGFKGAPVRSDMGIVREAMTEYYLSHPAALKPEVDGRWLERPRTSVE